MLVWLLLLMRHFQPRTGAPTGAPWLVAACRMRKRTLMPQRRAATHVLASATHIDELGALNLPKGDGSDGDASAVSSENQEVATTASKKLVGDQRVRASPVSVSIGLAVDASGCGGRSRPSTTAVGAAPAGLCRYVRPGADPPRSGTTPESAPPQHHRGVIAGNPITVQTVPHRHARRRQPQRFGIRHLQQPVQVTKPTADRTPQQPRRRSAGDPRHHR
jgi:hypothetical protein